MDDKELNRVRWYRRKAKHHKDHDNGKSGFVGGNVRYDRERADALGNRTMGRARDSRS